MKDIDNYIVSDFSKPFITKISFCAGFSINNKNNAVYYPSINKLVSAFENKEKVFKDVSNFQKEYNEIH